MNEPYDHSRAKEDARNTWQDVVCDACGDVSNSAPGLPCGRVDGSEPPCTGTYQPQEA